MHSIRRDLGAVSVEWVGVVVVVAVLAVGLLSAAPSWATGLTGKVASVVCGIVGETCGEPAAEATAGADADAIIAAAGEVRAGLGGPQGATAQTFAATGVPVFAPGDTRCLTAPGAGGQVCLTEDHRVAGWCPTDDGVLDAAACDPAGIPYGAMECPLDPQEVAAGRSVAGGRQVFLCGFRSDDGTLGVILRCVNSTVAPAGSVERFESCVATAGDREASPSAQAVTDCHGSGNDRLVETHGDEETRVVDELCLDAQGRAYACERRYVHDTRRQLDRTTQRTCGSRSLPAALLNPERCTPAGTNLSRCVANDGTPLLCATLTDQRTGAKTQHHCVKEVAGGLCAKLLLDPATGEPIGLGLSHTRAPKAVGSLVAKALARVLLDALRKAVDAAALLAELNTCPLPASVALPATVAQAFQVAPSVSVSFDASGNPELVMVDGQLAAAAAANANPFPQLSVHAGALAFLHAWTGQPGHLTLLIDEDDPDAWFTQTQGDLSTWTVGSTKAQTIANLAPGSPTLLAQIAELLHTWDDTPGLDVIDGEAGVLVAVGLLEVGAVTNGNAGVGNVLALLNAAQSFLPSVAGLPGGLAGFSAFLEKLLLTGDEESVENLIQGVAVHGQTAIELVAHVLKQDRAVTLARGLALIYASHVNDVLKNYPRSTEDLSTFLVLLAQHVGSAAVARSSPVARGASVSGYLNQVRLAILELERDLQVQVHAEAAAILTGWVLTLPARYQPRILRRIAGDPTWRVKVDVEVDREEVEAFLASLLHRTAVELWGIDGAAALRRYENAVVAGGPRPAKPTGSSTYEQLAAYARRVIRSFP